MSDKSYNLLQGKTGVIFGALNKESIAWQIAEKVYAEGGRFVLSNAPIALQYGSIDKLAAKCGNAPVVAADATNVKKLDHLFKEVKKHFDGIDFILHSIGMSPNIRKDRDYTDMNYDWMRKTFDISAMSLHKIITKALPLLNDHASIVALTYIGAQRIFSKYTDMNDAKALLESIARNYGANLGERGIRVNTVSQSPTRTTAGKGITGFDAMVEFADKLAPLGNASAKDCADYIVTLFSDLTRKVTMQNLFHDGGFSSMGLNKAIIDMLCPPEK